MRVKTNFYLGAFLIRKAVLMTRETLERNWSQWAMAMLPLARWLTSMKITQAGAWMPEIV